MDGIIVVNKEQDYTSFDVVAKLRGILKQKKMQDQVKLDSQVQIMQQVILFGSKMMMMKFMTMLVN